ncbi:MAG: hypothetical protein KDE47_01165 [Caldilineaceae bacterium]|nr:hypothetical protein [Caldilineaceae bacterium]
MQRVSLLLALLLALLTPALVRAQDNAFSREVVCTETADAEAMFLSQVIPLLDAIPEQPNANAGVFYTTEVEVFMEEGMKATIGGPDGQPFWTDDQIRIVGHPSKNVWMRDFRSGDRLHIVPEPEPQDFYYVLSPGQNTLHITLENLLGPVQSTSAYVLMLWQPCSAPVAAQPAVEATEAMSATTALLDAGDAAPPAAESDQETLKEADVQRVSLAEAPDTAYVAVQPARVQAVARPLPTLLWLGAPLGLLLLGLVLWQGRQMAPTLQRSLRPALVQARASWRDLKAWLESMQK